MKLAQYLALQQKLAPQLIHSLQLLQLPTLELEQLVKQHLELNPLLELDEDVDQEMEEESPDPELEEGQDEGADLELLDSHSTELRQPLERRQCGFTSSHP